MKLNIVVSAANAKYAARATDPNKTLDLTVGYIFL